MGQVRGVQTKTVIFEETSYRTLPATPSGQLLPVTSVGLSKTRNKIDSAILTDTRARVEPLRGNVDVSGDIATEINAESIGTMLKHAIGSVSTTGAGPYVHNITIGNLPVGLTIEVDYGPELTTDRYVQYAGCRIGGMALSFPTEGACTATFSIVGAEATLASAALDASPTNNGATPFSSFDATIIEGGNTLANCREVTINLDNGLDTDGGYVIGGGGTRSALAEGFVTVTGQIVTLFEDSTLLNKALNSTETSLQVTLQRGSGDGSPGNEKIVFVVEQLKFDPQTPPVEGPGGLLVTLPFSAYKVGANQGFHVDLYNNVATI